MGNPIVGILELLLGIVLLWLGATKQSNIFFGDDAKKGSASMPINMFGELMVLFGAASIQDFCFGLHLFKGDFTIKSIVCLVMTSLCVLFTIRNIIIYIKQDKTDKP